jgi:hypothetical protein
VKGPALPAPSTISPHRVALSQLRLAPSHSCVRTPHEERGACAIAHSGFGSYGVMLLAVAIVLLGIMVLAVTWRRGRAGAYRVPVADEQES